MTSKPNVHGLLEQRIVDCSGRTTHRMVLRIDGLVVISDAHGDRALVDPRTRTCLTAGAHVSRDVMELAASLIQLV
jgi:hypothetical protein